MLDIAGPVRARWDNMSYLGGPPLKVPVLFVLVSMEEERSLRRSPRRAVFHLAC